MTETIAVPTEIDVPVKGGEHMLTIRPWNMAQHDRCFPIVVELLEHWANSQKEDQGVASLGAMVSLYKEEVTRLCRFTVDPQLKELGLTWEEDLYGEDLFIIAEAIWQTSLLRPGGGGVMGKAIQLLGPMFLKQLASVKELVTSIPSPQAPSPNPSSSPSKPISSPPGSPSSAGVGEAPQSNSVMN